MDIIDKLKKGKKGESVFDSLVKKKEPREGKKDGIETKPSDMEVTQLSPDKPSASESVSSALKKQSTTEFKAEGMHEFDIESLGEDGDANIKVEYKAKVNELIDKNNIDDAINLLLELKAKLAGTSKPE